MLLFRGLIMRWILIVISLLTIFLAGQVSAANRAQKPQVAKEKAEVLEQNAAPEGRQTVPSPCLQRGASAALRAAAFPSLSAPAP